MFRISRRILAAGIGAVMAVTSPAGADPFGIVSLNATGSSVVEHDASTGDDRGGIAVSTARVFYTGDNNTGRFNLTDLLSPASGTRYDALAGNIKTGDVYTFGVGVTPATGNGVADRLLALNASTGALTGGSIMLSSTIHLVSGSGIFSGSDRIVIHTGTNAYSVALPSGVVTDLGPVDPLDYFPCENHFYWGVAEEMNSEVYVTYRQYPEARILRTRLSTGAVSLVSAFTDLSDLCSFTVWPTLNRWYFHFEGDSQFGGTQETVGFASAAFTASFPDTDGDGSVNIADNCLADANADQLDSDGDFLGDACDPCPGDPDIDGDEACEEDNCPFEANPGQEDADDDGFGDVCDDCPGPGTIDSDGDGACNETDNCFLANPDQADLDSDGEGDLCDSLDNSLQLRSGSMKAKPTGLGVVAKGSILQDEPFFDSPDASDGIYLQIYDNAYIYLDHLFEAADCSQTSARILCQAPDNSATLQIKLKSEATGKVPFVLKLKSPTGTPPFFLGPLTLIISDSATAVDREGVAGLCSTTPSKISCR